MKVTFEFELVRALILLNQPRVTGAGSTRRQQATRRFVMDPPTRYALLPRFPFKLEETVRGALVNVFCWMLFCFKYKFHIYIEDKKKFVQKKRKGKFFFSDREGV